LKKEYYPANRAAAGTLLRWVEIVFSKPAANKISDSDPYFVQTLLFGRLIKKFAGDVDEGVFNKQLKKKILKKSL